jgi:two-component system NarL family sensor kinase
VQGTGNEIMFAIIVGSATAVILAVFFIILVIIYQKRIAEKQLGIFKAILETQEHERSRIARDLHDEMGPLLSAIKLNLNVPRDAAGIRQEFTDSLIVSRKMLDEAITQIRSVSHDLMPNTLNRYGLSAAIEELAGRFNRSGKVNIDFAHSNYPGDIKKFSELNIYRTIQEVVNNAIRHGQSSQINIFMDGDEQRLNIRIKDNGTGFDKDRVLTNGGIGLKNIESRIKLLEGKYMLESAAGKGTQVMMTFDYEKLRK